jgi:hypothetical protein
MTFYERGYVTICNTICVYYVSICVPKAATADTLEWCGEFELLILYLWSLRYLKHTHSVFRALNIVHKRVTSNHLGGAIIFIITIVLLCISKSGCIVLSGY